jgi:hypothetical protein
MPLIPYPNVPIAPGVPNLARLPGLNARVPPVVNDILAVTDPRLFVTDTVDTGWALLNEDGTVALEPDSFVALDYRGENRICNYPVERGSFSAYNKVALPYDLRLILSCGGSGAMSRQQFMQQLDFMRQSTNLYSAATPDGLYDSLNLTHVDYRRESRNGVSLIIAACWFEEVRQTAIAAYSNTRQASGANPVSQGQVIATPPTTDQTAAYSSKPIQ